MIYSIADTAISVRLNRELEERWRPFLAEDQAPEIALEVPGLGEDCYGIECLEPKDMAHVLKNGEAVLLSSGDWSRGRLYGLETEELAPLLQLQLQSWLMPRGGLLFHSSLVDWQGKGILFVGPSGVGKTTQAELWARYQGAKILNGDMVFVRQREDGFCGYGSPWHGSSPYYEAAKVQLSALVVLHQGPENVLKPISGFEALRGIMEQVFLPIWDRSLMDRGLETLDQLLEQVPAFELSCRPEAAATALLLEKLCNSKS